MLELTFSSKLDWGSYIISISKTTSKKIVVLICSMKFLSPEVALYLYKSTIRPCTEYCCYVWVGASNCYLELLDKLQKRICKTVGPSLAASLEPLTHHFRGRSTLYSVTIPRCYKDFYVNSFFPRTARPWNSLAIEYFCLTYDLSGFKCRINRHLLTVGSS